MAMMTLARSDAGVRCCSSCWSPEGTFKVAMGRCGASENYGQPFCRMPMPLLKRRLGKKTGLCSSSCTQYGGRP